MLTINATVVVRDGALSVVHGTPTGVYQAELVSTRGVPAINTPLIEIYHPFPPDKLLPDGTLAYVEGLAVRSARSSHRLEITALQLVTRTITPNEPLPEASVVISGVVRVVAFGDEQCLHLEVGKDNYGDWCIGVDISSFKSDVVQSWIDDADAIFVSGRFCRMEWAISKGGFLIILKPSFIKTIPTKPHVPSNARTVPTTLSPSAGLSPAPTTTVPINDRRPSAGAAERQTAATCPPGSKDAEPYSTRNLVSRSYTPYTIPARRPSRSVYVIPAKRTHSARNSLDGFPQSKRSSIDAGAKRRQHKRRAVSEAFGGTALWRYP